MSGSTLRFSGNGGTPVDEFVRNVTICANKEGRQLDNKWNVEFVATRLSGPALKWYENLDKDIRGDWSKLRKALEDKYSDNKQSPPKRSIWRRATGSSSRGPSRSNSLVTAIVDSEPPSYDFVVAGGTAPSSPTSYEPSQGSAIAGGVRGQMDATARRIRLVSKASGKEVGYLSRFPTALNWFVYTTDVSEAMHVRVGNDNVFEILNGPPSTQPPIVLTVGWSEDGRGPAKEAERYASLGYYEKSFGGFLQARDGWVAKWQSGPSSRIKPLQKKGLGFSTAAFTVSISERTKAIRLHSDLKAYKRGDPEAIEVDFELEPLK